MSAPNIVKTVRAVPIRQLMNFTPFTLLEELKKSHNVLFEDGKVLLLSAPEIIVNRYLLQLLEKTVPDMPIYSRHSATNYYTNGIYTSKTINTTFEVMFEDIIRYINGSRALSDKAFETMYDIVTEINNVVIPSKLAYSASLHILDFLEIQFNEELIRSIQKSYLEKTHDTVNESYGILEWNINNLPELKNNPLAIGYISKTFNPNQVKQMLGPRGYVTEINSKIFQYPISSSFTLGLTDIYDLTIESRSGAKALFLSNKAIQNSEYTARELQLVTMVVEELVDGDCGNTDYLPWKVRTIEDAGKSDLDNMLGKRYYDPIEKCEKIIRKGDKHLEGTTILLRTSMNCKLTNKKHICTACFGELSYNVHKHSNIGHLCTTFVTQQISQSILSTKHLTSSATSNDLKLTDVAANFFNIKSKIGYAFKPKLISGSKSKFSLIITQFDAPGLKDINPKINIHTLIPQRVTKIASFILSITPDNPKQKTENFNIHIKEGSKYGAFTYEFLQYIVDNGYVLDDYDRYVIDLSNWTSTETILTLPQVEFNFLALSNAVKSKFKYMKIDKGERSIETQESMLQSIFDLINSKLNINIALLEVMVYAFSIMSIKDRNYDLSRNSVDTQLMSIGGILSRRSLGGLYAWERVLGIIISPTVFDGKNAFNHPLDVYIKPNEVILDKFGTIVN